MRPLLTYPILSCNSNNSYNIIVYNILHRSFRLYLCRLVGTGSLILAKLAFRSCNAPVGTCKFVVLGVAKGLKSFINFFKLYFFYFTFIFYFNYDHTFQRHKTQFLPSPEGEDGQHYC